MTHIIPHVTILLIIKERTNVKVDNKEIYVSYGNKPLSMVKELLETIKIHEEIPKDAKIGLKPNLVVAKPASSGATTSPELVAGVIEYLQEKGFKNISILEGSWVGDRTSSAFKVCGYETISKKYGVPLVDTQKDTFVNKNIDGLTINVCKSVAEIDYLINMPVLKGHCQTIMTCALKNLKGCITNNEKRRFHSLGLHKPIACLSKAIKQSLIIVDALMGDLTFEEGGNPVEMNRIMIGKDPVLIDSYGAELIGYSPLDIDYIPLAAKLGVGTMDTSEAKIIEINKDTANTKKIVRSRRAESLGRYAEEKEACSACYGTLIHALDRLEEKGSLRKFKGKIKIGQGFKGYEGPGIGIGLCCKGCESSVMGCPPKAKDIVDFLENL